MSRKIIFRDGVLFDNKWNAIDPTKEELEAIKQTISKYESIKQEVTV